MNLPFQLILGSGSPRRQQLLKEAGFDFQIRLSHVAEDYPATLKPEEVALYLAEKKALGIPRLNADEIILTADTTVIYDGKVLGKPQSPREAEEILKQLSGNIHSVITGCALFWEGGFKRFSSLTRVEFEHLTKEEIRHYILNFEPFDKAGAYGIQEWIGLIGVKRIEGCYYNVMGLPISRVYKELSGINLSNF
jgi:septum formation protein